MTMAKLTAQTAKAMARELYGYELTDESAEAVANAAGAIGYPTLLAEAERIRKRG
jgi:hypothetical protein